MADVWANSMACHTGATCHIAGCSHLAKSMSWLCHITGCKNSIRHIENCFSPYLIFFCFYCSLGFDEWGFSYRLRCTMNSAHYAVARCLSVCLSVCPSTTRWYSVKTVAHILKLFSPLGSHTILVFQYRSVWQYSYGDFPNRAVEYKELWKNQLRPISRFISEIMQYRAIVNMEGE